MSPSPAPSRTGLWSAALLPSLGAVGLHDAQITADRASFARVVSAWHIRWTLLPTGSPAAAMLDALPGWRRLHSDPVATVHVRTAAP